MKKRFYLPLGICFLLGSLVLPAGTVKAQSSKSSTNKPEQNPSKKMEKIKTIKVEVRGMSCQEGCANGIDASLKNVAGIIKSKTSFDRSSSEITFDDTKISEKEILAIIEKKGFKAKLSEYIKS